MLSQLVSASRPRFGRLPPQIRSSLVPDSVASRPAFAVKHKERVERKGFRMIFSAVFLFPSARSPCIIADNGALLLLRGEE